MGIGLFCAADFWGGGLDIVWGACSPEFPVFLTCYGTTPLYVSNLMFLFWEGPDIWTFVRLLAEGVTDN